MQPNPSSSSSPPPALPSSSSKLLADALPRIQLFTPPDGYERSPVPPPSKTRSLIYDTGVRVKPTNPELGPEKWYCLVTPTCKKAIRIAKNQSNITDHLRALHSIASTRSLKRIRPAKIETSVTPIPSSLPSSLPYSLPILPPAPAVTERIRKAPRLHPERHVANRFHPDHHIAKLRFVLRWLCPLRLVECQDFRNYARLLDDRSVFQHDMTLDSAKKIICDMYMETSQLLRHQLAANSRHCPLPCFHVQLCFTPSSAHCRKICAILLSFIDDDWHLCTRLLAVRHFDVTFVAGNVHLVKEVTDWSYQVWAQFGITPNQFVGAVSKAGEDGKAACEALVGKNWDCCLLDLLSAVLHQVLGNNHHLEQFVDIVLLVIVHIRKSSCLSSNVQPGHLESIAAGLNLFRFEQNMWEEKLRALSGVLALWDEVCKQWDMVEKDSLPVEDVRKGLVEFFSLLKPIVDILATAANTSYPAGIDAFLKLCLHKKGVLCVSQPLPIYDPSQSDYEENRAPSQMLDVSCLQPGSRSARLLLSQALERMFFESYDGIPRSSRFELQVFFHPAYRNLICLDSLYLDMQATVRREEIVDKVVELGVIAANSSQEGNGEEVRGDNSVHYRNDSGLKESCPSVSRWGLHQFEDCYVQDDPVKALTTEESVRLEVNDYLTRENCRASSVPTESLLGWWKKNWSRYPRLGMVARGVLGFTPSVMTLGRNLIWAEAMLDGFGRGEAAVVDMSIFLNRNFELIPSHVPKAPSDEA